MSVDNEDVMGIFDFHKKTETTEATNKTVEVN